MSIVDRFAGGAKVTLDEGDPVAEWWRIIHGLFEHDPPNARRLARKRLAMLALQEAGWTLDQIGAVWDHHKGHVSRSIAAAKSQIRRRLDPPRKAA